MHAVSRIQLDVDCWLNNPPAGPVLGVAKNKYPLRTMFFMIFTYQSKEPTPAISTETNLDNAVLFGIRRPILPTGSAKRSEIFSWGSLNAATNSVI